MRILGIDYGTVRCGIAISDPLCFTAQPLMTLDATKPKELNKRILEIIDEYAVDAIVLGYPKKLDGTKSAKTEEVDKFLAKITNVLLSNQKGSVKIYLQDERLTTVSSNRLMNELDVRARDKRKIVDTIAATYILQSYLDALKNKNDKNI